jgi:hypothetical protein
MNEIRISPANSTAARIANVAQVIGDVAIFVRQVFDRVFLTAVTTPGWATAERVGRGAWI